MEKVDFQNKLKELVAGERASIEATQREMERDVREQEDERKRRQQVSLTKQSSFDYPKFIILHAFQGSLF